MDNFTLNIFEDNRSEVLTVIFCIHKLIQKLQPFYYREAPILKTSS